MLKKILKFLRFINKKTLNIQFFLIPTHIRAKFQVILFCTFPKYVGWLSIKSARLPRLDQRFNFNLKFLNEIIILNKRNFKEKKISLFIRSIKKKFINRRNKLFVLNPIYLKNETEKRISNQKKAKLKVYKNRRFIYVTSDHSIIKKYIKNNLNILFVQTWKNDGKNFFMEKWEMPIYKKVLNYCKNKKNSYLVDISYNTSCNTLYLSSALVAACFFAKVCKKVKIYNWDFYMNENPKRYGFFKIANLLYPLKFRLKNNVFLETSLCHWYFIYKLLKLSNVSIDGHLTGVVKNRRVVSNLKSIFCK